MKTHFMKKGADYRGCGQTDFEYANNSLCGYVRKLVTENEGMVTCYYCKRLMKNAKTVRT